MKLKYYMRGLGIGIVVTTFVLSFGNKKEKLSDSDIIAQARDLGMVMKDEEADNNLEQVLEKSLDKDNDEAPENITIAEQDTTEDWSTEQDTEEVTVDDTISNDEVIQTQEPDIDQNDTVINEEDHAGGQDITEDKTDDSTVGDTITFIIDRGMSSGQVSELLKQKGLIEDAKDFDNYIRRMGKAKVIRIGTYVLPKDTSYEMILDAIVG